MTARMSQRQNQSPPAAPLPPADPTPYTIHYSQALAENCPVSTPSVSAIIVQQFWTGQQLAFSALRIAEVRGLRLPDELPACEKELLGAFGVFCDNHPDALFVHWRMGKLD